MLQNYKKSVGTIIMATCAAHFLRDFMNTTTAKRLIVNVDKKTLQAFDKADFMIPLEELERNR